MTMKLLAFLDMCNCDEIDVDVCTDYTDELEIAYCGWGGMKMTDECVEKFKDIFDLDIEFNGEGRFSVVKLNDLPDDIVEEMNKKVIKFFYAHAGYVDNETYERWFVEV